MVTIQTMLDCPGVEDNNNDDEPSMLEYSMTDCMFSRYIYPANGS